LTMMLTLALVAALSPPQAAMSAGSDALASAREEFAVIAAAHRGLTAYDLQVDIRYTNGSSTQAMHASVACDGAERCLRVFQGSTTLETPGRSLLINSSDRTITVAVHEPASATTSPAKIDPEQTLTSWLDSGGKLSGGEITPEGRHWIFHPSKPEIPEAQMYVNEQTHLLHRLIYESAPAKGIRSQVDIHYTWNDASRLDPGEFDPSRYIQERGALITPAENYAEYRIIRADRR
jgi:hypothetical protein